MSVTHIPFPRSQRSSAICTGCDRNRTLAVPRPLHHSGEEETRMPVWKAPGVKKQEATLQINHFYVIFSSLHINKGRVRET